jgi:glycosyltransferase involved in cell wall biosynthesis
VKILAVVPHYVPDSRVGAWIATHELLVAALVAGQDVQVVRYYGTGRTYEVDGVTVSWGAGCIERQIRDADVVVSHLGDNQRAHRAATDAGVPSVRMVHGHGVPLDRLKGAALVVWNSEATASTVSWDGPSIVVHPPVNPDRYRTLPGDAVTLVNLTVDKGVRTFWRLAERFEDRPFLGVRGGYGHQIIPRARNVEVVGPVRDMRDVYGATRVLVMPSEHETWGRCGIEAMVSGVPVIAHPTPGLVESLGCAGIFVDRDDLDGWAAALQLLDDPDQYAVASQLAYERAVEVCADDGPARFVAALEEVVAGVDRCPVP